MHDRGAEQQWAPSGQQQPFAAAQQPGMPVDIMQQVLPLGHSWSAQEARTGGAPRSTAIRPSSKARAAKSLLGITGTSSDVMIGGCCPPDSGCVLVVVFASASVMVVDSVRSNAMASVVVNCEKVMAYEKKKI
eukprot:TRINITY_DN10444_c0_g1_i2.p2 TRINITY_DN10444_c0_g1~~TRINITY_DN10444_c0_g1_i2.p2  ORF type:complete len:133 (-),score=17.05 TRINITY_DN10444_c0_g1_i2:144-542(-)